MIKNKRDLIRTLDLEKKLYLNGSKKNIFILNVMNEQITKTWKYIKLLRKTEYFQNNKSNFIYKILFFLFRRKKNKLGVQLGIEVYENCIDEGLQIYHCGNIIINRLSKIGKNCKLHGSNCIGNNGINTKCPTLGDNVTLGVGAKVIGDVYIANNIIIGAGSVVTKSFYDEGITIAGVPAKKIK